MAQAVAELDTANYFSLRSFKKDGKPVDTPVWFAKVGDRYVVFTDGTDHAHRVTRDQLDKELDATDVDVMVIGVGAEIDASELRAIGRRGAILSKDRTQIATS